MAAFPNASERSFISLNFFDSLFGKFVPGRIPDGMGFRQCGMKRIPSGMGEILTGILNILPGMEEIHGRIISIPP